MGIIAEQNHWKWWSPIETFCIWLFWIVFFLGFVALGVYDPLQLAGKDFGERFATNFIVIGMWFFVCFKLDCFFEWLLNRALLGRG